MSKFCLRGFPRVSPSNRNQITSSLFLLLKTTSDAPAQNMCIPFPPAHSSISHFSPHFCVNQFKFAAPHLGSSECMINDWTTKTKIYLACDFVIRKSVDLSQIGTQFHPNFNWIETIYSRTIRTPMDFSPSSRNSIMQFKALVSDLQIYVIPIES